MASTRKVMKYVVCTGGTLSGLGKGTAVSSMGVVLKSLGLRVTSMKIDPYLNIDAGTMSPYEHGEVFVLDDGGEVDLDLGNYERSMDVVLTSRHSVTTGKIYQQVIERERRGEYLGKTVQIVPHITDAVQDWIEEVAQIPVDKHGGGVPDVCMVELGGTVGDIESAAYLEALQQFQMRVGKDNIAFVHLAYVPVMGATMEQKTKPAQHSVKLLREAGLKPDFLMCRSELPLEASTRKKCSVFCQVVEQDVVSLHNVPNIYRVPHMMWEQGVGRRLCEHLKLDTALAHIDGLGDKLPALMQVWDGISAQVHSSSTKVVIAVVGKYTGLHDSYMSVIKALQHAATEAKLELHLDWVDSEALEQNMKALDVERFEQGWRSLTGASGVLVPGAFGDRGIEGKIAAAKWCREQKKPYFGICVGLQCAVIEYARTVCGMDGANSTEFQETTPHPVVVFMPEVSTTIMGGTMRLGSRATIISDDQSRAYQLYGKKPTVFERHRHRYEVNPDFVRELTQAGLVFSGTDERARRMEIVELPSDVHPYYFCTQYHPEFQSRPTAPSAPFLGLVLAAAGQLAQRLQENGGCLPPSKSRLSVME